MRVVATIRGFLVRAGGESHQGWLPPGAAEPKPTPTTETLVDLRIEQAEDGFYLIYAEQRASRESDTWHESLQAAQAQAERWFQVRPSDWILST
jgi:hypothetical protein